MKIAKNIGFWRAMAGLILLTGAYAAYIRFVHGLGASTNLSDTFPWGIWIGFDVLIGVGLAAGGFTIAAVVHIFNLEKYEPISRPSLLTAYLGYILVGMALMFDIGRPLRLWHPLIMWNPHSVMFEVAWCVTLYTTVLTLEFSPIIFERFNLKVPLKLVRAIYLPLVILGVILSTLHQSSLGTVYVIVPDKLHGLWYSPLLPIFFFLSAIAVGLAMTIVESFLSARAFHKEIEHEILEGLARVIVVVLAVYVVWKFMDLVHRNNLYLAFQFTPESVLFWTEIGVGSMLPALILFLSRGSISHNRLFLCALLVVMGFMLNRLNVSITGMLHSETYIPKWSELAISLAMVTGGFVVFSFAVQYLPIFPSEKTSPHSNGLKVSAAEPPRPAFPALSWKALGALWLVGAVGVGAFALAVNRKATAVEAKLPPIVRRVRLVENRLENLQSRIWFTPSEDSPGQVIFSHRGHVAYQEQSSCRGCHSGLFSFGLAMTGARPEGKFWHTKQACGACHDGEKGFKLSDSCETCHTGG